ncbi:MAG TPA: hypothetical protein VMS76_00540 [Planctomycetota bacterium]|nr:hypothetical protein [Planctomycetota bacterium]
MASDAATTQSLQPAGERGSGDRQARRVARVERELPPLHARDVGELLDTALDVLRARFVTCVLLSTSLWIPAFLAARRLRAASARDETLLILPPAVLLPLLVQSLTVALVTVVVYGHMQGHRVGARTSLGLALRRAPALILASLLANVAIAAGMLACLVPGILLSWLLMVAPAALVLERLGPIQALGRSSRLVRGSFGRWIALMLTQFALALPLSAVSGGLDLEDVDRWTLEHSGLAPLVYEILVVLLRALVTGVATAFAAVTLTLFYIDCRVRREGFDLWMRLERLRERARPAPVEARP